MHRSRRHCRHFCRVRAFPWRRPPGGDPGQAAGGADGSGLLLVDVQLAEGSGFGVCAYARSRGLPVIFRLRRREQRGAGAGHGGRRLHRQALFGPESWSSRIRSVLRRYGKEKTLVPLGGVMVDTEKGRVTRDGRDVYLGAGIPAAAGVSEPPGKGPLPVAAARGDLGRRRGDFVNDNTLTVYIKRLREKIETDPADPQIIRTVRGIGYMVDA